MNFLGLAGPNSEDPGAKAVVLQAPYDATCTWGSGAAKAPEAILRASIAAETYDEMVDIDLERVGIATLPAPSLDGLEPERMVEAVCAMTLPVVRDGKIPAGLGGEHTVTLGFLKALLEVHPDLSVLQIDAHPDLRPTYEGRTVCHATVGRRILEWCPLVQAGVRAFTQEERRFIEEEHGKTTGRLHTFSAFFIRRNPDWIDRVIERLSGRVYLSLDLDALDPSFLPHTGTPEPGGLSWWDLNDLLAALARRRTIVGFDLVELAADETSRASDFTAARLAMRLIGLCVAGKSGTPGPPF